MGKRISDKVLVLLLSFTVLFIFKVVNAQNYHNNSELFKNSENSFLKSIESKTSDKGSSRVKRNLQGVNTLGTNIGAGTSGSSVEGLLASCQLTNLLLYQLLSQKTNQLSTTGLLSQGTSNFGSLLQPINQIFLPSLTTYLSTSTYTTQSTETATITIPLLFGNKPSPTTITRTKTHEITTSTILTITTTIKPTPASTIDNFQTSTLTVNNLIKEELPSSTPDVSNELVEEPEILPAKEIVQESEPIKINRERKRRKNRPQILGYKEALIQNERKFSRSNTSSSTTEKYTRRNKYAQNKYGDEYYYADSNSPQNYGIQDEVPSHYQYAKNNNNNEYYNRRLKRRGEIDGENSENEPVFERDFLLEPSFDSSTGASSIAQQCPQPVEITVTKTITKFVNPPASILPSFSNSDAGNRRNFRLNSENSDKNRNFESSTENSYSRAPNNKGRRRERVRNFEETTKNDIVGIYTEATTPVPRMRSRSRSRENILNVQKSSSESSVGNAFYELNNNGETENNFRRTRGRMRYVPI